jgi:predicted nucleic acid-binding protein
VALFHLDASALVKLVREEPESQTLGAMLDGADMISSELALTEVPRAIRRAAANDPRLPLEELIEQAGEVLGSVAMLPVDEPTLLAAGALAEPTLRSLDAIHLAAALQLSELDAFVSYDNRQSAAARKAGLHVEAPGRTGAGTG